MGFLAHFLPRGFAEELRGQFILGLANLVRGKVLLAFGNLKLYYSRWRSQRALYNRPEP